MGILLPSILALFAVVPAQAAPVKFDYFELPPYSYTQDGAAHGNALDVEISLLKGLDVAPTPEFVPIRRLNFEADRTAFIVVAIIRNAERDHRFQWIGRLCTDPFEMVTRAPSPPMDTLDQARKARSIAVAAGAANEIFLRNQGFTNIDPAADIGLEVRRLAEGHDDAWFAPHNGALFAWKAAGYDRAALRFGAPIETMSVWMAASLATPAELVETLRGRFAEAEKDRRIAAATGCPN